MGLRRRRQPFILLQERNDHAHVHLLCYLPSIATLQKFHSNLSLADRGTANSRCKTSLTAAQDEEERAREELLQSQQAIEKAKQQVALIPTWDQKLKVANAQLAALETAKAKDVIALQRQLSNEKEQRTQIVTHVRAIRECVNSNSLPDEIKRLLAVTPVAGATNNQELKAILQGVNAFEADRSAGG